MAVYNQPQYLELVLWGFSRQTFKNFEVVISDDGSNNSIKTMLENLKPQLPYEVSYTWQNDLGIRKTKALNEGIKIAKGDYLIFTDPDCVPHKDFVLEHIKNQQKGRYLIGRRVKWGKRFTSMMTKDKILDGYHERLSLGLLFYILIGDIKHAIKGLKINSNLLHRLIDYGKVRYLFGSNFSIFKEDILKVNGWNEEFAGALKYEDVELDSRLKKFGFSPISVKYKALTYHLYHPSRHTETLKEKFEEVERSNNYWCKQGIIKESVD